MCKIIVREVVLFPGKCKGVGKCEAMVGESHRESVTGGRKRRRCSGEGARAAKSEVPELLLEEIARVVWRRR